MLDTEGCFAFFKGLIRGKGGVQLTLAIIYAPNDHQDIFFCNILTKLLDFKEKQLILGRDFNVQPTPAVDTSSASSFITTGSHRLITQALHRAQLIDDWRLQHSGEETTRSTHPLIKSTQEFISS